MLYLARSANLVEYTGSGLRFTHQLLQEYFAAVYLSNCDPDSPQLLECLRYEVWDETVLLLSGLTSSPDKLVEHAIRFSPILASRCVGIRPETIASPLAERLVDTLGHLANDEDFFQRRQAVEALGMTRLRASIPVFTNLIIDHDSDIRQTAIQAASQLELPDIIPLLVKSLKDSNSLVRMEAAKALGKLGAKEAIPDLVNCLAIEEPGLFWVASHALADMGYRGAIPRMASMLRSTHWGPLEDVAQAMLKLGAREIVRQELVKRLDDQEPNVRGNIAEIIVKLELREATKDLVRLICDPSDEIGKVAARAIIDWRAEEVIPDLLGIIHESEPWKTIIRESKIYWGPSLASNTLAGLAAIPPALSEIRRLLLDPDKSKFIFAIGALSKSKVREPVPELHFLLSHSDPDRRSLAAEAIGQLGIWDELPGLIALLHDPNEKIRGLAAQEMRRLNVRAAIPELLNVLNDSSLYVRAHAALALGKMRVTESIPVLRDLLYASGVFFRRNAAWILADLGVRDIIPKLLDLLHDVDWQLDERSAAEDALVKLNAVEAIPGLIQLLHEDTSGYVQSRASWVLKQLCARQSVDQNLDLLRQPNSEVRRAAAWGLGRQSSEESIKQLVALIRDSEVEQVAIEGLVNLKASRSIPSLVSLLREINWMRREMILRSLVKLGALETLPILIILHLADSSFASRKQASLLNEVIWPRWIGMDVAVRLSDTLSPASLPPEVISHRLQPLTAHPDKQIRNLVLPIYEEGRRQAGEPRDPSIYANGPMIVDSNVQLLKRVALWSLVTISDEALVLFPDWSVAKKYRSESLRRLGCHRHEGSISATEEDSNDRDWKSVAKIGRSYSIGAMIKNYMGLLNMSMRNVPTEEMSVQLGLEQGNFPEALVSFREMSSRFPRNVTWRYSIAFAQFGMGQIEDGKVSLDQALNYTELHEEVQDALRDLDSMIHVQPDNSILEYARDKVIAKQEALDQLADEECNVQNEKRSIRGNAD